MYLKYVHILFCFYAVFTEAQYHELGAFVGGSNYIGDIGTNRYLDPNSLAYGVIYKWNKTDRFSFRVGFTLTKLTETEFNNNDLSRFNRSYKMDNDIQEVMAGFELNFKKFNLHTERVSFTPFIFYGLSYFRYNQYYQTPNGPFESPNINDYGKDQKIAFPIILGLKVNPKPYFVLGFEIGARYTLTDNLDGSNPENQFGDNPGYKFGNITNNDWYIFTGFTISFTFGDLPCYCKD